MRPQTLDCSKWVKWHSALCFKRNIINTSVEGYSVPECINRAFYQRVLCIVLDTLVEHLHITNLPSAKSQGCALKFTPTCVWKQGIYGMVKCCNPKTVQELHWLFHAREVSVCRPTCLFLQKHYCDTLKLQLYKSAVATCRQLQMFHIMLIIYTVALKIL